jgi:selenocysteine lyase/cysteine desulfurase
LRPDKLLPSSDAVPERFELGTLPYELLAGTTAAVDFIAGIVHGSGDRRAQVQCSMRALEEHEDRLFTHLLDGLAGLPRVRLHGTPRRRTPTAFFSVDGLSGQDVNRHLASRGVNAPASSFYAVEACRWIGLGDEGAVRAGLAPYTRAEDVERLLAGVREVAR